MAKTLSIDLELNAQGYKKGISDAKKGTAEYTNATRDLKKETDDYIKSFGSLTQQFRQARKEAKDLAAQYVLLGKAEKQSEYGQELAESLDIAIRSAAELQKQMSFVDKSISNLSSNNQGWSAMKDALDIGKEAATAYAGAVAKLTGNDKALKDVISTVAMVQGGANAVIKIGNALQKQSNVMIAIGNVQLKAKAIAEELATKKTIAATIAQRAFNAVANANPYVLLASVILAAATAIGTYMVATSKANKEEERAIKYKKELHDANIDGQKDAQKEVVNLRLLYDKTQDVNMSMEDRLDAVKKIKDEYPSYFGDLTNEAILAGEAADAYKQLTQDIIAAATARAYQGKLEDLAKERIELEEQRKAQEELAKATRKSANEAKNYANTDFATYGTANISMSQKMSSSLGSKADDEEKKLVDIDKQLEKNTKHQEELAQKIFETNDVTSRLAENEKKRNENNKKSGNTKNTEKEITELQNLEKEIDKLEKKKQNIKNPFSDEGQKEIENLNNQIAEIAKKANNYKISIGVSVDKSDADKALLDVDSKIEKLNKQKINVNIKSKEGKNQIKEIVDEINELKRQKLDYYISVGVKVDKEDVETQIKDIENKLSDLNKIKVEISDFGVTSEELATINSKIDELSRKKLIYQIAIGAYVPKEEIENAVKGIDTEIENLNNEKISINVDTDEGKARLQEIETRITELNNYKVLINVDIQNPKSKLDELKDELKLAKAVLPFAISDEDVQAAWDKIHVLEEKIENEEVRLKIKVEPAQGTKDTNAVQQIMDDISKEVNKIKPRFNFDLWPDVSKTDEAKGVSEKYDYLIKKREELNKIMSESTEDQAIHDAQLGIDTINKQLSELEPELSNLDKLNEKYERLNNVSKGAKMAGKYIGDLGNAFSALGSATENDGLKAIGIIAQTLANLALSFSEAMVQAAAMGPWAWIAFGITGLAQLAAMITQIKQLTAGGYANGGVIPGNSYSGDKLLARVNSNEMVFNTRQQKRLYDIANGLDSPNVRGQDVTISSVRVQGRDLVLAIKNELKTTGQKSII